MVSKEVVRRMRDGKAMARISTMSHILCVMWWCYAKQVYEQSSYIHNRLSVWCMVDRVSYYRRDGNTWASLTGYRADEE